MSALGALAAAALAYCPSYTASSPNNTGSCAVEAAPGPNPSLADWQTLFAQVAQGPAGWGASGPSVSNFTVGCNQPSTPASRPPRFPCELVKAIAYQESLWQHFCVPDRPADQVGGASRTIIAVDCGYGVGQVTSGMRTFDPTPSFDRARVASSPLYNLATGMQILRDKWQVVACVGDRQPQLVEHWYSATWAYNGLSAVNSPNNANYSTTRGPWNPSVGGNVPYQERVWGRMQFPPSSQHWPVLLAGYPSLLDVGTGTRPNALPDPVCGSPTSCATTRPIHTSTCLGAGGSGGGAGGAGGTGGAGGSAGAGGSGGSGGTGGTAGSGGTGGIGGTGGGAPVEPDAGRPDVTLPSAQDRLWPAAGCGCQAVDVDVALLLAGLGLRRRRRLAPSR